MRDEYDFRGGVRGKYSEQYRSGPVFVLLDTYDESVQTLPRISASDRPASAHEPSAELTQQLFESVLPSVDAVFVHEEYRSRPLAAVPRLALYHFASCLQFSFTSNARGEHSVALALLRQSFESLLLVAAGLQKSPLREELLETWSHSRPPAHELTTTLLRHVAGRERTGLWGETWSEFLLNLSRAVQPYAHYSPELAGWQVAVDHGDTRDRSIVRIAPAAYDVSNAARIALLHGLLVWSLAQVTLGSVPELATDTELRELAEHLRTTLRKSQLLANRSSWPDELVPRVSFER